METDMDFEFAYDLAVTPGKEAVFVKSDDRHRKVRVLITEASASNNTLTFCGNSLGSSVRQIKAAKKDEPPVPVNGHFEKLEGVWKGSVGPV